MKKNPQKPNKISILNNRLLYLLIIFLLLTPALDVYAQASSGGVRGALSSVAGYIGQFLAGPIMDAVNNILYLLIGASAWIFAMTSGLLAIAIGFGFQPSVRIDIIYSVWTIFRDVANVFFVFILLIIAIATILRLESYGIKRLLPTLILVAFFINFSLLVTQYVIYPANWLSEDLVNLISRNGNIADQLSGVFHLQSASSINSQGGQPLSGSGGFLQSVSSGALVGASFFGIGVLPGALLGVVSYLLDIYIFRAGEGLDHKVKVFAFGVSVLIINVVAIFTLLAAAVMVVARTAILMMLMVISPLAFLAHAVPGAQDYARKWWSTLLNQSMFLPVYLLFLYLGVGVGQAITRELQQRNANFNLITNPSMLYFYCFFSGRLDTART